MGRVLIALSLSLLLLAPAWAKKEGELPELVNPGFHEPPPWFKVSFLDLAEDLAEAREAGKRLALYFYQDGCPYCARLLDVNFALRDIVDYTRARFDVLAINMWGDREVTDLDGEVMSEKRFAEKYRVMFTPTLLFLDEQGKVSLRVNGYYPPHKFMTALRYAAGEAEPGERFVDFLARVAPPKAKGTLHAEPGFRRPPLDLRQLLGEKPLLVLFEQKDCPPCDELHGDILKREETRRLMERFTVAQLDLWGKSEVVALDGRRLMERELGRAWDVKFVPTMVFFDAKGEEVFRAEAYLKAFHIQSVLDYVASGAYREQPSFQRFIEARADRLREQGVEIDLMR